MVNASDRLALDRQSSRTIDQDGHLHVALSNISKAVVNPYYGREIPDGEKLGLQPDKIYQLMRDPDELAKGADSFNGKPLLIRHQAQDAATHDHDVVVGSINKVAFNAPYLQAELHVWDADAIAVIQSGAQRELSCAYRYKPVLESGTYDGVPYDIRMTEILGNHVALVADGRAGSDCVVGDSAIAKWSRPFLADYENVLQRFKDYQQASKPPGKFAPLTARQFVPIHARKFASLKPLKGTL